MAKWGLILLLLCVAAIVKSQNIFTWPDPQIRFAVPAVDEVDMREGTVAGGGLTIVCKVNIPSSAYPPPIDMTLILVNTGLSATFRTNSFTQEDCADSMTVPHLRVAAEWDADLRYGYSPTYFDGLHRMASRCVYDEGGFLSRDVRLRYDHAPDYMLNEWACNVTLPTGLRAGQTIVKNVRGTNLVWMGIGATAAVPRIPTQITTSVNIVRNPAWLEIETRMAGFTRAQSLRGRPLPIPPIPGMPMPTAGPDSLMSMTGSR